jgi:hypothetical protein
MTVKVTIEVPDQADYRVEVKTCIPNVSISWTYLDAGMSSTIYIHDALCIESIREVLNA